MQWIKKYWRAEVVGLVVLIVIAVLGGHYFAKVRETIPINPQDSISSWSFKGADSNDASITKTNADIAKLTALLGKGTYPDYDIYVAMAQDYDFLGDGQDEYVSLEKATVADPTRGVAWDNIGVLMENLVRFIPRRAPMRKRSRFNRRLGCFKKHNFNF